VNFIGKLFLREWFRTTGDTRTAQVTPRWRRDGDLDRGAGKFLCSALIMRKRINELNGRVIIFGFLKIAAASAALSAVCYATLPFSVQSIWHGDLYDKAGRGLCAYSTRVIAFVIAAS